MHKKDGVFEIVVPFTSGVVLCFGDCVPAGLPLLRYEGVSHTSYVILCSVSVMRG